MAGVSDTGYTLKSRDDIISDINDAITSALGSDIVTDEDQPLGQIIGIIGDITYQLSEQQQSCYNAFDPSSAYGAGLSALVRLNGITRKSETYTTVTLTLTGDEGTTVEAGSLFTNDDGDIEVETLEDVILTGSDGVDVEAQSTTAGEVLITAGAITTISTVTDGLDSVTNSEEGDTGSEEETDAQLRARRDYSVSSGATGIYDALKAAIYDIDEVSYCKIYENDTSSVDAETGQAAYTVLIVVKGGEDEDVAQAIYDKKSEGVPYVGNTTITLLDDDDNEYDVSFTRPTDVPVYVNVNIVAPSTYSSTLASDVAEYIVEYAEGDLVTDRGYGVGDDVPISQLYTPINQLDDVSYVSSLEIGRDTDYGTSSGVLNIDYDEISTWDTDNITVTITTE